MAILKETKIKKIMIFIKIRYYNIIINQQNLIIPSTILTYGTIIIFNTFEQMNEEHLPNNLPMFQYDFYTEKIEDKLNFVTKFKQMALKVTTQQKHLIRKMIISKMIQMSSTITVTGMDPFNLKKSQNGYDSVVMKNCTKYHVTLIEHLSQTFIQNKVFKCQSCGKSTNSLQQCYLDSFALSYINSMNPIGTTDIYFRKLPLNTQQLKQKYKKKIEQEQNDQLTILKGEVIEIYIIAMKKQSSIAVAEMAKRIIHLQGKQKSINFMNTITKKTDVNLICFYEQMRINTSVANYQCSPETHNNKFCQYSLDYVFNEIEQGRVVKCLFPLCQNFISKQNFQDVCILNSELRRSLAIQKKFILQGQFTKFVYNKGQEQNIIKNYLVDKIKIIKLPQNQRQFEKIAKQCSLVVRSIDPTDNTKKNPNHLYKILSKQYKENKTKNPRYVVVKISSNLFSSCPVRCIACKKIQILQVWMVASQFIMKETSKCPNCQKSFAPHVGIRQIYKVDIKFVQFVFLQGKPKEKVIYDCLTDSFMHPATYYTGQELAQKLINEKKIFTGVSEYDKDIYTKIQSKLEYAKTYKAFIHQRCSTEQNFYLYYLFVSSKQYPKPTKTIGQNVETIIFHCPRCKQQLQVSQLLYDQKLTAYMQENNNNFQPKRQSPTKKVPLYHVGDKTKAGSIFNMMHYQNIQDKQNVFGTKPLILNLKSYYNQIIQQPIFFIRCKHPIETCIVDFKDIITLRDNDKKEEYQCRYKKCRQVYTQESEVYKVDQFDTSQITQDKNFMKQILKANFWVKYDPEYNQFSRLTPEQIQAQNGNEVQYRNYEDRGKVKVQKYKRMFKDQYQRLTTSGKQNKLEMLNQDHKHKQQLFQKVKGLGNFFITKEVMDPVSKVV